MNKDYIEHTETYAYIPETGEFVKYDEVLSIELKDKYHEEICQRKEFVGEGYIMHYDIYGNLLTFDVLDLIYVDRK